MAEIIIREEQRLKRILNHVEKKLSNKGPQLDSESNFASLMLGVAMLYTDFRYPHDWRTEHPQLSSLVETIANRPSFQMTEPIL